MGKDFLKRKHVRNIYFPVIIKLCQCVETEQITLYGLFTLSTELAFNSFIEK